MLECLQKALKVADTCMDSSMNVHLFVEILNRYLFYFDHGNEAVQVNYISKLIDLINKNMATMETNDDTDAIRRHFRNTVDYIKVKKAADPKYEAIAV